MIVAGAAFDAPPMKLMSAAHTWPRLSVYGVARPAATRQVDCAVTIWQDAPWPPATQWKPMQQSASALQVDPDV